MTDPVANTAALTTTSEAAALVQVDRVVGEIKTLITQSVMTHYEIGKRFLWLKENTPHGHLEYILSEQLEGTISVRTAQKLMLFAGKCAHLPKFRAMAEEGFSKAMLLLSNLSDDELQEIELDGNHKLALDKTETMSFRELQAEIKKLREEATAVRENERKLNQRHIEGLEKEMEELRGQLAAATCDTPETVWLKERTEAVVNMAARLKKSLEEICRLKKLPEMDPTLRATIEGNLAMSQRMVVESYQKFVALSFPMDN